MKVLINTAIICLILFSFNKLSVAQNWVPFSHDFFYGVNWLSVDSVNNRLVFGGQFTKVDNDTIISICAWDGNNIIDFDGGLRAFVSPSGGIWETSMYHNELYASGPFQKCINKPDSMNTFSKWDGSEWDTVFNVTLHQAVGSLTVIDDTLFIGGLFDYIWGQPCSGVLAYYNGQIVKCYSGFPNTNHRVAGVLKFQNDLYAFGLINGAGPDGQVAICKWKNQTQIWERVDNAFYNDFNASIMDAVVYKGELYVCGDFWQSASVAGNNIMKWNGTDWIDIGGLGNFARDMEVHDGLLYVAGAFYSTGGLTSYGVGVYNGTNWLPFNPTPFSSELNCLAFYNNELYVCGGFTMIGSDTIKYVAKWNNTLPSGIKQEIKSITNSYLYPNPATDFNSLFINSKYSQKISIQIVNVLGQVVQQHKLNLDSGFNRVEFNLKSIASGFYAFNILDQYGVIISHKLIKS